MLAPGSHRILAAHQLPVGGRGAPSARRSSSADGDALMFTATLHCGQRLAFEVRSFVPAEGELVPCRHHGYCLVSESGQADRDVPMRLIRSRRQLRSSRELVEFLRRRPVTTVHVLRRSRFTLRVVLAAQREGLVDADLVTGRVSLRVPCGVEQRAAQNDGPRVEGKHSW